MGKQSRARREKMQKFFSLKEGLELKKKARFYDLIRQEEQANYASWLNIGESIVIDSQNVFDWLYNSDTDIFKELSNREIRPIYRDCFIEFTIPKKAVEDLWGWSEKLRIGVGFLLGPCDDDEIKDGEEYGYSGNVAVFWTDEPPYIPFFERQLDLTKTDDGRYEIHLESIIEYQDENFADWCIHIALWTFAFLNCRNVGLIEHKPDTETSKAYQRNFGKPLTYYKTLRVKPIGKDSNKETQAKEYQALMPFHFRRGNFATYTDDAPLFGKFTGTFWRPATVVGEEKRGVVVKDYEVLAPEATDGSQ